MGDMISCFALEYELMARNETAGSEQLAELINGLFLSPTFFDRAAILQSPFLRNRPLLRLLGNEPFRVIADRTAVAVSDWISACHSHGHLSVWFVPRESSRLEAEILEKFHLDQGREVRIGGNGPTDPLAETQRGSFESLFRSGELRDAEVAFCLSHDAAQMFRVALDSRVVA